MVVNRYKIKVTFSTTKIISQYGHLSGDYCLHITTGVFAAVATFTFLIFRIVRTMQVFKLLTHESGETLAFA